MPEKKSAKKAGKRLVADSALRVVKLEDLHVDPAYQREVLTHHVSVMTRTYNPKAVGIPLVAERDDGTLWIVDGLQRITMLKNKGNKWVRAEVFASTGPEEEAEIFRLVNKFRKRPTAMQVFHASLAAGDETAWKINKIVEEYGFKVPHSRAKAEVTPETQAKWLTAVAALERVYKAKGKYGGEGRLRFALEVLSRVWPNDAMKLRDSIIMGLGMFYARKEGAVDKERLIPRLMTTNPTAILYSSSLGVGDRTNNTADVIEKLYAKRYVKGHPGKRGNAE